MRNHAHWNYRFSSKSCDTTLQRLNRIWRRLAGNESVKRLDPGFPRHPYDSSLPLLELSSACSACREQLEPESSCVIDAFERPLQSLLSVSGLQRYLFSI